MKVTVCNNCGVTMQSGLSVCRRCNQKDVVCYDLYCDSSTERFNSRVGQLSSPVQARHSSPLWSAVLVMSIAALILVVYDYQVNPYGVVAQQARAIGAYLNIQPPQVAGAFKVRKNL